jgi:alpha-galactosidase
MTKHAIKLLSCLILLFSLSNLFAQDTPKSLTPEPPQSPRINGPAIFGLRPGSQLIYHIPASGARPMKFAATGLPRGVTINETTGTIKGLLNTPGQYIVTLKASNALGLAEKSFKIVVGNRIALTPPMGWSSWNCFGDAIDQKKLKILRGLWCAAV